MQSSRNDAAETEQPGTTTREKSTFATTTARKVPLEFSASEEIWHRLTRPRRLPRIPRPPVRKIAALAVGLVPKRVKASRALQLARRHPGFAGWVLIFAGATASIAGLQFVEPHYRWEPERYQKWLSRRGAQTIRTALAEIGPSVTIPSIQAQPERAGILGSYALGTGEITFNSSIEYHPVQLLETAAHECVHGIFVQNKLTPEDFIRDDYLTLVNEVAAYVLGAHITGAVLSRDGYDSSIVTEALFQMYRGACDPANPDSTYNHYLVPGLIPPDDRDRNEWHSVLIHFGAPLQLGRRRSRHLLPRVGPRRCRPRDLPALHDTRPRPQRPADPRGVRADAAAVALREPT